MLCGLDRLGNGTYASEGIKAIAQSIAGNPMMTRVDVSGNSIGDDGMRTIGAALLSSTTSKLGAIKCDAFDLPVDATSLDLSGKRIDSAAWTLLAGVVKGNALLKSVHLSAIELGAANILAPAIRDSASLTEVLAFDAPPPTYTSDCVLALCVGHPQWFCPPNQGAEGHRSCQQARILGKGSWFGIGCCDCCFGQQQYLSNIGACLQK